VGGPRTLRSNPKQPNSRRVSRHVDDENLYRPFCDSNFNPSCSWIAVKIEGPDSDEVELLSGLSVGLFKVVTEISEYRLRDISER
jgi:hypothetical protein